MNQECLIQKLWNKSLISITRIIGIIFVIIIFNGCHVFPHIYIDDEDKEYKKEMVYIVKPDIKTKYIDTVLSIW